MQQSAFPSYLQPYHQLDSPRRMKLARTNTEQHREIAIPVGCLAFIDHDNLDIMKLSIGFGSTFSILASETTQNVPCLFITTDFAQPTRRLREEPDDRDQDQERDDLEGDGKSWDLVSILFSAPDQASLHELTPSKRTPPPINKTQPKLQPIRHHNPKNI